MKTRSTKELLQLYLNEGERRFKSERLFGLCSLTMRLVSSGNITEDEYDKMIRYITRNRPKIGSVHHRPSMKDSAYFWREGAWEPRRKWLEDHIKSL